MRLETIRPLHILLLRKKSVSGKKHLSSRTSLLTYWGSMTDLSRESLLSALIFSLTNEEDISKKKDNYSSLFDLFLSVADDINVDCNSTLRSTVNKSSASISSSNKSNDQSTELQNIFRCFKEFASTVLVTDLTSPHFDDNSIRISILQLIAFCFSYIEEVNMIKYIKNIFEDSN